MGRRRSGRDVHGILLLDKAQGVSSNKALQQVKALFNARKAGHTGTLDPLATGMLPVCLGEGTKISAYLLDSDKEYLAGARFGVTTDTADRDGSVLMKRDLPDGFDEKHLLQSMQVFKGEILQTPPMYSALKHQGKRLYELAREGKEVERKARKVSINELELVNLESDLATIRVRCSKGTYIRTLVEDIGEHLGCGAHIDSLRRLSVCPFDNTPLLTLEQLQGHMVPGAEPTILDRFLLPIDSAINHLRAISLGAESARDFQHGRPAHADPAQATVEGAPITSVNDLLRLYDPAGQFLGIGVLGDEGRILPKRVLNL